MTPIGYPKVLAITKRTAELCGTQAELYMAGFELIAATSVAAAKVILQTVAVKGVIVCKHSWSESERESIASEIAAFQSCAPVILRCFGCTGCDEAAGLAGVLQDTMPLKQLISAVKASSKS